MLREQPLLVLSNVINRLDNKSICSLSQTCKYFNKLTKDIRGYIKLGLFKLCEIGNLEGVKYLVSKRKGISIKNEACIVWASLNGHLEVVKYLVSQGANVSAHYNYSFGWASLNGHLEMVKYLVSQGAPKDNWAVVSASMNGHLEVIKYLVSIGINVTYNKNLAVIQASNNNHHEVVKYLISQGARLPDIFYSIN